MRQADMSPRAHAAPLDRASRDRLLRAVAELRALDRQRQRSPGHQRFTDELARRVEAKAREVFRLVNEAAHDESRH